MRKKDSLAIKKQSNRSKKFEEGINRLHALEHNLKASYEKQLKDDIAKKTRHISEECAKKLISFEALIKQRIKEQYLKKQQQERIMLLRRNNILLQAEKKPFEKALKKEYANTILQQKRLMQQDLLRKREGSEAEFERKQEIFRANNLRLLKNKEHILELQNKNKLKHSVDAKLLELQNELKVELKTAKAALKKENTVYLSKKNKEFEEQKKELAAAFKLLVKKELDKRVKEELSSLLKTEKKKLKS